MSLGLELLLGGDGTPVFQKGLRHGEDLFCNTSGYPFATIKPKHSC